MARHLYERPSENQGCTEECKNNFLTRSCKHTCKAVLNADRQRNGDGFNKPMRLHGTRQLQNCILNSHNFNSETIPHSTTSNQTIYERSTCKQLMLSLAALKSAVIHYVRTLSVRLSDTQPTKATSSVSQTSLSQRHEWRTTS